MKNIYHSWKELPSNYKTKTRLKSIGLKPSGKPVGIVKLETGQEFDVFDENTAAKIEYKELDITSLNFAGLNSGLMNDYAICSLTTTGTRNTDEIIQMVLLDTNGNFLFNKKFKPATDIHPLAYKSHKMASYELSNEPSFEDAWFELSKTLEGKTLVMADYKFNLRLLKQTCEAHHCKLDFKVNVFDLKENKEIVEDFSGDYSSNSVQSSNPIQDTITILNQINPRAELFRTRAIAINYFNELCAMKTARGESGVIEGLEWLKKNFKSSNFDDFDLRICNMIAKALEPVVK